jgi:hypothetical protein
MGIVLRNIDPTGHSIRRTHPVDAAAFSHRDAWLD